MNSLKKGEGVPFLNFEGGPGVPLLNFEGGSGVPLLNFRGVPGPTFKLWRGSRVPGPRSQGPEVPDSGVLVPLLHHAEIVFDFKRQKSKSYQHSCKIFAQRERRK